MRSIDVDFVEMIYTNQITENLLGSNFDGELDESTLFSIPDQMENEKHLRNQYFYSYRNNPASHIYQAYFERTMNKIHKIIIQSLTLKTEK